MSSINMLYKTYWKGWNADEVYHFEIKITFCFETLCCQQGVENVLKPKINQNFV